MIRPCKPADIPVIMDIGNRAWRDIHAMFKTTYGPELYKLLVPDEATRKGDQIKSHCQAHPDWVRICEEDGRIVGFVTFFLDPKTKVGTIGNNAVDPDCGLKGIGQQMYQAILALFRSEGMAYANVGTGLDEAHARARKAYERIGFNIRHEKVEYYMKL